MKNIFFIGLILALFSFSCDNEGQGNPLAPIILGAIYNLTGGQASLDIPSYRGAQLAIQQANDTSGVHNKMVQLILKDGQTNADTLRAKVLEILQEAPATLAFLGLSDTDQVLAAAGEAASNDRMFVTSGATSPLLPGQIPDYLYLACFGDNVQAAAAAEYAFDELEAKTVAVVYDSTDTYTQLLQQYFISRFEDLGGQVISQKAYTQGDMAAAVQPSTSADFIYFAALPQEVLPGIQLIRQAGFSGPIIGGDSYDEPEIWEGQSQLGEVYFTTHAYLGADNPSPTVQAFRQAYIQTYGGEEPTAFAALGYDAAQLLIRAIQLADEISPEALRQSLAGIQNFEGVTGTISFSSNNRIPTKSVTIMTVSNEVQTFVMEIMPREVPTP